jgi:hypothetical protein
MTDEALSKLSDFLLSTMGRQEPWAICFALQLLKRFDEIPVVVDSETGGLVYNLDDLEVVAFDGAR